jgi:hypothetical protein
MGKYYETDREAMKKARETLSSGKFWQPKEGKNQIRILPPWSEEGKWFLKLGLHYGFKDEEDRNRAYPCFKDWKGQRCPACDAISELKKVDGGQKIIKAMSIRTKCYVNLIDRRVGEDKVFIYGFSPKVMNEILSYDEDEDYGDITHPKKGFDVVLERTGSGLLTKYAIRIKPKPIAVGKFGELYDLDAEVPNIVTPYEMAEMLAKQYGELLEEFSPEDYGKKPKKKKAEEDEDEEPRKKRKVEEDDEEEEPKKKSKKKSKKDEEDDDE